MSSYHFSAEPEKILRVESRRLQCSSQSIKESLQPLNGLREVEAVRKKHINWSCLPGIPTLERYLNGDLALVLDVPAKFDREVVGERMSGSPGTDIGRAH